MTLEKGHIYRYKFATHKYLLLYEGLTKNERAFQFKVLYCSTGLYKKGDHGRLNLICEGELEEVEKMSEVILELL